MARLALHATAVAWGARAALILGRSGSGKSALALDLMAWGCALVADDRVMVWAEAGDLRVAAPASLRGLVEARGVGLLRAEALAEAQVVLLVDLDAAEPGRLPPWRERLVAGVPLPCLQKPATGHFAAAILQYLKAGRAAPAPPEAPAGARPSQDASRAAMPPEPIEAETPHAEVSPAGSGAGWPGPEVWGRRVVLVTGPSGAGRSTAIRALEDLGFEVIDNLPLSLLPRLLEGGAPGRPLALGLDVRNRDWTEGAIARALDRLAGAAGPGRGEGPGAEVLFLDCADEVLLRRFSETRRRHPLAPDGAPAAGIARERELLAGLRERADLLVDTTELGPHDLRARLDAAFAPPGGRPFAVSIESFSYKRGLPGGLDMAFDCRFLRNPHWDAGLRPLDGRDEGVAAFVRADPRYAPFLKRLRDLLLSLLPAFREEGKAHLAVGLGCTGGQHRSVTLALDLAKALADGGWQVSSRHRELERRAEAAGAAGVGTTR